VIAFHLGKSLPMDHARHRSTLAQTITTSDMRLLSSVELCKYSQIGAKRGYPDEDASDSCLIGQVGSRIVLPND
jgi:hypothetical protein